MKIGVIGAGNWGKNIVKTLHSIDSLHSVAEASPETRNWLGEQYPDLKLFESYEDLLKSDAEAVAIATPAETHYPVAKAALESGKDVFVEKPITLSSSDAESLAAIAEAEKRVLMVGHLLLYQPAVQWIKQALDEGLIGEVYSLHQERLNLGRARAVENVLWCLGVHDIAVLQFLIGKRPKLIASSGQCALQPCIEDDYYLHLGFDGGTEAHVHVSWLWPERRRMLTIIGSKGMLVYDELAQTVTHHKKTIDDNLQNVDGGSEVVFEGSGAPLTLEMEHFISCVQNRSTPMSSGQSAIDNLKVMEATAKA